MQYKNKRKVIFSFTAQIFCKLRQGLRRGEYILTWVPGRANLSVPMTKEILGKGASPLSPCERLKRPLLDGLRTNNINLKGVKRVTKTQTDVSKY
jgi:hypothetical protein